MAFTATMSACARAWELPPRVRSIPTLPLVHVYARVWGVVAYPSHKAGVSDERHFPHWSASIFDTVHFLRLLVKLFSKDRFWVGFERRLVGLHIGFTN